ncbi:hypothetical protein A2757_01890 [Candidatus Giovannonibacteria bacterium RIFCSPHIGHO2_01_FULL_48_47]|nr:MAG: hypothetical protein A2757_01890 [Candidatus Giovannonibacteria bacterium RIFCSPHIGHO2_01_FULL_48_47]OGF68845.1 MAG: hypothetical protein A3D61_03925 [Candidatus Giovannonibacteria bacterium RIFCSPHIGHO2_02_FULL_48_15]OGF88430.1 MAG: hypothetical protein A3B26_01775 [Candidatus Giovannonibacteria bacterium RIFCSPLOWO2_01_FULL_48_47]OGF94703.1 MAG: hypothetical protein A2433_03565 [Candidatus Giovannonibacteria bacterium RIFOXYC1_FULL_48_8]OGF96253.1 MAG: hypothetical protein A2613_01635
MPQNIITTPEQKFSDELKKELKGAKSARFAVGWFFISGLKELKDAIDALESLELLISPTTNWQTAEMMLTAEKFDEAVQDKLEAQEFQTPEEKKEILENEARALLSRAGRLQPNKENKEFLIWLAEKLAERKIKLRIYTKELLHAKVYLVDKKDVPAAFTGSSNISISGFSLNTEVNVRLTDAAQVKKLNKWFEEKWKLSEDCDFTVLAETAVRESWALNDEVTPFRIYLRILHDIFSLEEDHEKEKIEFNEDVPALFPFQKDAVIDAYRKLGKYKGVFLADVPGVGKTYMGAALLAHLQEEGEKSVVICSPKIIEQWEQVLDDYNVNAKVISRGKLSDILNDDKLMQRPIVLIDEAHHFRNPETASYKDLQIICEGKKVVLVGATPQNLKLLDMYHQIKLFHPQEMTDVIRIDPPELKEFFKKADEERQKLNSEGKEDVPDMSETLFQQILIRRTRKNIIDEYGMENLPHFPKRLGPYRIDYNIDDVYPGGVFNSLEAKIDNLVFARYDIGNFIKEEEFTEDEKQRLKIAGRNLRGIMRMILFKLLESSVEALRESLRVMVRSHELFLRGLEEGKVLAGEAADKAYQQLKEDLDIEEIEIPETAYEAERFRVSALKEGIEKDAVILKEMHEMIKNISVEDDDKLQTLIKKIKGEYSQRNWDERGKEKCDGKKVLIFTQYASTAQYIGEELKKHFSRVEYVSGDTGDVLRRAALFSSKTDSNRKYLKKRGIEVTNENEIDILVSTEMLGEGINLQDGQVVINYELHWNPVRIIQRVGRIDRIGSQNEFIWVYNFFPQLQAEARIGIEARIKRRIQEIQTRFGGDEKVISQDELLVDKKFYQMYSEDRRALEEQETESFSAKQRSNWLKLKSLYPEEYAAALRLPTMVHCGKSADKTGVAVYCRANDIYKLYLGDEKGKTISENDWEVLGLLECDKNTADQQFDDKHYASIESIKQNFQDRANRIERERYMYLELVKRQAIDRIEKAKRGLVEKTKRWMSEAQGLVREVQLDVKTSRDLRGVIRQKHGLLPKEMVEQVEKLLKGRPKVSQRPVRKLYAEIILSESLK